MFRFVVLFLVLLFQGSVFAQSTKTELKALFETGDTITQANFEELIDSTDPAPRMVLGDKFYAITGEELQLFYRGFVEHPYPYNYGYEASGLADAYRALGRYYKVLNASPFTHSSATFKAVDLAGREIASASTDIEIVSAVAQPSSDTRVLCIGDSLTANNTAAWVSELNRMLTSSDAASGVNPAGLNYSNIDFIGTQGSGSNLHEGHSGRTIEWHATNASSPFMNSGSLDFANYVSTNSFGGIEQVYILLGHNSITSGGPDASDWSSDKGHYETLIDAILDDYSSCKITLLSMQGYGKTGMIGNRSWWDLARAVNGHKLMLKSIADDATYSSSVDWIDLAAQFDIEYSQPATSTAVNVRNASDTEDVITDPIHPNAEGYDQIADAVKRHFVAKWCQ